VLTRIVILALFFSTPCVAQWQLQDSRSHAGLRGIHAVSDSVAWATGTNGTVLRTTDGGAHWTQCPVPTDGERLDFRGVWAWSENEALVLSSGPGAFSRVYRTTDACAHWTEQRKNTDLDGFWDALVFQSEDFGMLGDLRTGVLLGDPVGGTFHTEVMLQGQGWFRDNDACKANPEAAAFAASNSSVFVFGAHRYMIATGGKAGARIVMSPDLADPHKHICASVSVPITGGTDSSGVFSLAFRDPEHGAAVGGDYKNPNESAKTAAFTKDGGEHWKPASKTPHGFRSAVAWDAVQRAWIAVGTNGSDISRDDGKTWQPLDNGNWNAVSLPFAVGPDGRIGKLAH
jgi:photosystem II stability/assembly factor-like uncharacterized protein